MARVPGDGDDLLGRVLDLVDREPDSPQPHWARETATDIEIDGRPARLWRGWYANGEPAYEQTTIDLKNHGREVRWNGRGRRVLELNWREGALHGPSIRRYADGQLAEEARYDAYRLDGPYKTWHRNGRPHVGACYRAGLRHGEFVAWHAGGARRCRANFSEDRLEGTWRKWDPAGRLVRRVEYRGGAVLSQAPPVRRAPFPYPGRLGSGDFAFVLSQGGFPDGYNVLRVSAAGRCEFRYGVTEMSVSGEDEGVFAKGTVFRGKAWRKAVFPLTDAMQRRLRDALAEANLFDLEDAYIDKGVFDGSQWSFGLRAGGRVKRIHCDNRFPEPLRKLCRAVREHILVPHEMELATASRYDPSEDRLPRGGWPDDSRE